MSEEDNHADAAKDKYQRESEGRTPSIQPALLIAPFRGGRSGGPVGRRNLLSSGRPWLMTSSIAAHCSPVSCSSSLLDVQNIQAESRLKFPEELAALLPARSMKDLTSYVGEDALGSGVFLTFLRQAPKAKALSETRCPISPLPVACDIQHLGVTSSPFCISDQQSHAQELSYSGS